MADHQAYMHRCIELAMKGAGQVSPNPLVGAVLVHQNEIIGEGWHERYGAAHAEVNCIRSVRPESIHLIRESTLYVSLEPCAHFGKTPPCADFIIDQKIPKVVIGCRDTFSKVAGKGIQKLRQAGIEVVCDIELEQCRYLNRRFFTFHERNRPFIILKWAQSADGYIAPYRGKRVALSNSATLRFTHRLRSEEDSILIGAQTALLDNPELNTRHWPGKNPVRILIDPDLKVPGDSHILSDRRPTIIFNSLKNFCDGSLQYVAVANQQEIEKRVVETIFEKNLLSVIIEGGSYTLQKFIDEGLWDEAYVIRTPKIISQGIKAPVLSNVSSVTEINMETDTINFYRNE